jgi:4-amino-4-deoxy-L-arabinose transferase-like glycosyltransferase
VLIAAAALLAFAQIESVPRLQWDEGWTMTVARTWVEQGHYGLMQAGKAAPPDLAAAFPTTSLVALSFRLFGEGIWQARLPGMLTMLAAMGMLYYLARHVYSPQVGVGALIILLLAEPHPWFHAIFMGRQVLAEQMMLFLLLAGYVGLLWSLRRSLAWLPFAVAVWGLALVSKAQPLPFWGASLLMPLLYEVALRRWKNAAILLVAIAGTLGAMRGWRWLIALFLEGQTLPGQTTPGIYGVTAFVPMLSVRLEAISVVTTFGLLTVVGLGFGLWHWLRSALRQHAEEQEPHAARVVQCALLALAGSWFAWYLFFSVAWLRYFFPVAFVGSIFVALLLGTAAHSYRRICHLPRAERARHRRAIAGFRVGALLLVVVLSWSLALSLKTVAIIAQPDPEWASVVQTANYLNTHTPPDTLVESHDSELFFFLERPYHYPPKHIHIIRNRRISLGSTEPIGYDPLEAADPDYLVVGLFGDIYEETLQSGAFRLVQSYADYDIYERVRQGHVNVLFQGCALPPAP